MSDARPDDKFLAAVQALHDYGGMFSTTAPYRERGQVITTRELMDIVGQIAASSGKWLAGVAAGAARPPKPACVIGEYCRDHGFIHGEEAEELRERVETILKQVDQAGDDAGPELERALRLMLDDVDARDSCAYREAVAASRPRPQEGAKLDAILDSLSIEANNANTGWDRERLLFIRQQIEALWAASPPPQEPLEYTEAEVVILRANFEHWLALKAVPDEVLAILCPWRAGRSRPPADQKEK